MAPRGKQYYIGHITKVRRAVEILTNQLDRTPADADFDAAAVKNLLLWHFKDLDAALRVLEGEELEE